MKLLVLADIDEFHWRHGNGQADVVLSCGDVCDQLILEAAQAYQCSAIFAVKGNHDSPAAFTDPIKDLHLQVQEVQGLRFGGLNGAWRYKPRGHFLYDQAEVSAMLSDFPPVDIFLTHNGPKGIHDREDGVHIGFEGLTTYIQRTNPRLVFHGHQHMNTETMVGRTRIIGVYGHRVIQVEC